MGVSVPPSRDDSSTCGPRGRGRFFNQDLQLRGEKGGKTGRVGNVAEVESWPHTHKWWATFLLAVVRDLLE